MVLQDIPFTVSTCKGSYQVPYRTFALYQVHVAARPVAYTRILELPVIRTCAYPRISHSQSRPIHTDRC